MFLCLFGVPFLELSFFHLRDDSQIPSALCLAFSDLLNFVHSLEDSEAL